MTQEEKNLVITYNGLYQEVVLTVYKEDGKTIIGTFKLYQKAIEDQENEKRKLKGEQKKIEWGSQIRSYVFCPYTLVKDHRTNYEEGNIDKVMDGNIQEFIFSYLKSNI